MVAGCVLVLGVTACKKKEVIVAPVAVTSCIEDSYNGTYTGTGMVGGTYYTGPLTFTKLSCTSAKLEAGSTIENLTSLTASNSGGYTGVNANNVSATIKLTNDTLDIAIGSTMTFSGHK